jgi:uncharacterized protein
MRLFLDANVLFSASYREGSTALALVKLTEAQCKLFVSRYAVEEARRNLHAKAPGRANALDRLLSLCTLVAEPDAQQLAQAQSELADTDDAPILAAARAAAVDILVTGDVRHFGHLFGKREHNPRVMRLADALALVIEEASARRES